MRPRVRVAERVGFEPTVLSHTAFRERHHQPLGHLSAAESSKAGRPGPRPRSGEPASRLTSAQARTRVRVQVRPQVRRVLPEDARARPAAGAAGPRASASSTAEPQAPSTGSASANTSAVRIRLLEGADAHRARLHDGEDGDARQRAADPAAWRASRMAIITACAVGSPVLTHGLATVRHHRLIDDGHGAVRDAPRPERPGRPRRARHACTARSSRAGRCPHRTAPRRAR